MIRRSTKNGIVVLAALAILSWLGTRTSAEPSARPLEDLDTRLNYALWDFQAMMLDTEGRVKLQIQAPMLRNNASSGVGSVENPRIRIQQEAEEWYITADSAVITADREHVSLVGMVSLARNDPQAGRSMEIETRDVLLNVTPRTASTDARVSIVQDGDTLEAEGMKLDLKTDSYELLDKVRARYATP